MSSFVMSASGPSLLLHPLTLLAVEACHAAVMMGFTSPESLWRIATLPLPCWIVWLALKTSRAEHYGTYIQAVVTSTVIIYGLLDYVDRVLLQKWAFEAQGPSRTISSHGIVVKQRAKQISEPAGSFWARLSFGFQAATSRRHINTPYEVKNCRHFSAKDNTYVPSRLRFILGSLGSLLACYAFIDLNDANAQSDQVDVSLFSPNKVPFFSRLSDVGPEEVATRFIIAAMIWVVAFCMLQFVYDFASILGVGLGMRVESWRPMFGSILDLYSVRRFWGNYWHQTLRDMLNDPATLITHKVLRLPAHGIVPRYTKIVLAFFISGVVHQLIDMVNGLTWGQSNATRFFVTQALGIMIEDAAQEIWRRSFGGGKGGDHPQETARWKRIVGFIWVWAFMAWTVPVWTYALIARRAGLEEPPIMGPFSVSKWLMRQN